MQAIGKIFDYMRMKYINRADKDNIFPVGVTDAEFRQFCIEYLLGENWYVTDSLGHEQINEIALDEILARYSRQYRKEYRKHKRGKVHKGGIEKWLFRCARDRYPIPE